MKKWQLIRIRGTAAGIQAAPKIALRAFCCFLTAADIYHITFNTQIIYTQLCQVLILIFIKLPKLCSFKHVSYRKQRSSTRRYKKLSCRREAARQFVSFEISVNHSTSLKIIQNYAVEGVCKFLVRFQCICVSVLYRFRVI